MRLFPEFHVLLQDSLEIVQFVENLDPSAPIAVVRLEHPHVRASKVSRSQSKRRLGGSLLGSNQLLVDDWDSLIMVAVNHIEAVLELIGRIDHLEPACQVNHESERLVVKYILVI